VSRTAVRPNGDVSRQGDCRELQKQEYGPLDIVPYQLKNKNDTPRSGPSEGGCANPALMMVCAGSTALHFSGSNLAHRPSSPACGGNVQTQHR